jgi:hypothetical protein
MIIGEDLPNKSREELDITGIDGREIQTILEFFEYFKEIPPLNDPIKEIFISKNPEPQKPDLYLFTDLLQIKIPSFPKFVPEAYGVPADNRKTIYEIVPIRKNIVSVCIEKIPRMVKIEYEMRNGKKFSLNGIRENALKVELLLKSIILPNLVVTE